MAQVRSVDPDAAIDGDLSPGQNTSAPAPTRDYPAPTSSAGTSGNGTPVDTTSGAPATTTSEPPASVDDWSPQSIGTEANTPQGSTYRKDDLIGAAEGVFGKGAQGLASLIEDLLKKQGEPNAYIVGREGSGAIGVGLRYGSGTMHHKVEGTRAVYWTGPSIGFDAGLNAANAFVLVYNLYDTEDLYKRFPAGEGQAYLIGGFHVSYMRRGNVVLIPVRMGAGVRLGINAGYMKFTHEQKWLPF
ncbi:conserved hypothetical protein [Novosphingobium sp. 9U]|nr:conserved hypothetical protein [Novosphingobium sp. 9U]